jgi:hypothetical protein
MTDQAVELMGISISKIKKMTPAQRKTWWKKIPKWKKALLTFTVGPVLLPVIAAAGIAAAPVLLPAAQVKGTALLVKKLKAQAKAKQAKKIPLTIAEKEAITTPDAVISKAETATPEPAEMPKAKFNPLTLAPLALLLL